MKNKIQFKDRKISKSRGEASTLVLGILVSITAFFGLVMGVCNP